MALSGISQTVEVTAALKHPYQHPYGIAPCFPEGLKRAQSTQVGTHDTETLRIRYAVPPLQRRADLCSNRVDFGSLGELEHPYQHPYAVASVGRGLADA